MKLIVNANILFSALIKNGATRELMLNDRLILYAPEFVFEEFLNHLNELEQKTQTETYKLQDIAQMLITESDLKIVSLKEIKSYKEKARKISPDPNDVLYFATALKMNCGIWSNDKRLKNQDNVEVYATHDLKKLF